MRVAYASDAFVFTAVRQCALRATSRFRPAAEPSHDVAHTAVAVLNAGTCLRTRINVHATAGIPVPECAATFKHISLASLCSRRCPQRFMQRKHTHQPFLYMQLCLKTGASLLLGAVNKIRNLIFACPHSFMHSVRRDLNCATIFRDSGKQERESQLLRNRASSCLGRKEVALVVREHVTAHAERMLRSCSFSSTESIMSLVSLFWCL